MDHAECLQYTAQLRLSDACCGIDCCHSGTLLDYGQIQLDLGNAALAGQFTRESISRAYEVRTPLWPRLLLRCCRWQGVIISETAISWCVALAVSL